MNGELKSILITGNKIRNYIYKHFKFFNTKNTIYAFDTYNYIIHANAIISIYMDIVFGNESLQEESSDVLFRWRNTGKLDNYMFETGLDIESLYSALCDINKMFTDLVEIESDNTGMWVMDYDQRVGYTRIPNIKKITYDNYIIKINGIK